MPSEPARKHERDYLLYPDCIKCLRKKLKANGVVVFLHFPAANEWRIGDFQSDKPSLAAEIDCQCLLAAGVAQALAAHNEGVLFSPHEIAANALPGAANILGGSSVIAAAIRYGENAGVRIAWRDGADSFTADDLTIMWCYSECPGDCV